MGSGILSIHPLHVRVQIPGHTLTTNATASIRIACGAFFLHALEVFAVLVRWHYSRNCVAMAQWPAAESKNLLVYDIVAASGDFMNAYAAESRVT